MNPATHFAIDPGLSHTGIAISHEGILSQPLTTINTKDPAKLLTQLLRLIDQYQPSTIIIGQPQSGPIHSLSATLAQDLSSKITTPVHLINEDLSTKDSQAALYHAKKSLASRQRLNHAAAAAFILQSYLENHAKIN